MNLLTIRKVLMAMGQIFSYAVRHGFIDQNPLIDAERPDQAEHPKKENPDLKC